MVEIMDHTDIGRDDIPAMTEYKRNGLILDLHLNGKISWNQANELATFYNAVEMLELLNGAYRPDHPAGSAVKGDGFQG